MSNENSDKDISDSDEDLTNSSDEDNSDNDKIDVIIDFKTFFTVKELCYYKMIDKYFKDCLLENIVKMIDIIEGRSQISLRILDYPCSKIKN